MEKRVDLYIIGVLCLILCSLFQVQDLKTTSEFMEVEPIEMGVDFDLSSGQAGLSESDAIAYQEEQDRLAEQGLDGAKTDADAGQDAQVTSEFSIQLEDEVEVEDDEHHHSESEDEEKDHDDSDSDSDEVEESEAKESSAGGTFELGLISILDGEDGDLYNFLSATVPSADDISSASDAIIAYKNKLEDYYVPGATGRSSSNQSIIDEISELESIHSKTLMQVVGNAFNYLVMQSLTLSGGSYQSSILSAQSIFNNHKWTLGLSMSDAPLSQDDLDTSCDILNKLVTEQSESKSTAINMHDLILYGAVAAGGMTALSL